MDRINLNKKVFEYHKHINNLAAKFQMVPVYFPREIAFLVDPLSRAIELNYKENSKDLVEFTFIERKETNDYFESDFEAVKELRNAREKIVEAMLNDINEYAASIYTHNN